VIFDQQDPHLALFGLWIAELYLKADLRAASGLASDVQIAIQQSGPFAHPCNACPRGLGRHGAVIEAATIVGDLDA
jgi:hypothetical protein